MLAIELKNSIEKNLKIMIAVVDLLKGPSIEELSAKLISKIEERGKLHNTSETIEIVEALDDLTKEELEELLIEITQE